MIAGHAAEALAAVGMQVLVALKRGQLAVLEVSEGALTQTATVTLDSEVSCLDITPLGASLSDLFSQSRHTVKPGYKHTR